MKRAVLAAYSVIIYIAVALTASGAPHKLQQLTTSDGLSDLLVNTIYKDSRGYVWFGTGVALDRFDGNSIITFPYPENSPHPRRINAITEVRNGEFYIGSHLGLYYLTTSSDELKPLLPERIDFPVNSLAYLPSSSTIMAGTARGLFAYDIKDGTADHILLHQDALSEKNEINALVAQNDKVIYLATRLGLYRYDASRRALESYPFKSSCTVKSMKFIGDKLYLGTHGSGILVFDTTDKSFKSPLLSGNSIVTGLASSGSDRIFASTDGDGIFAIDLATGREEVQLTSDPKSPVQLRSNSVYSLFVDRQGLLWAGYYEMGADYSPAQKDIFDIYTLPDGQSTVDMTVRAVAIDGDTKLIGTREGLLYVNESTGKVRKFQSPDIRSNIIFCITPYTHAGQKKYYIGTYSGGMYVFDPKTESIESFDGFKNPDPHAAIFALSVDGENNLWAGTSRGLFKFNGSRQLAHYTSSNSPLPEGNVYEVFFDSGNRGWICTENGIALWNGSDLQGAGRFPKGFANNLKIRNVYEDSDHNLYLIPDRGKIFRTNFKLTEFGPLNDNHDDPGTFSTFAIEDSDGQMWFGTEKGLLRYDKRGNFHLYNQGDGLSHQVFNLCKPVTDSDGNLWMGNTRGLIKLDLAKLRDTGTKQNVYLVTDVRTNGRNISPRLLPSGAKSSKLALINNENNVSFSISDFSYTNPAYRYVEYMLQGYDSEWHRLEGHGDIVYYGLPSGKYSLKVRPYGAPEYENVVDLTVKPGFENWTLILYAFCVLSLSLVVIVYIKHRRRTSVPMGTEESHTKAENASEGQSEEKTKERYKTSRISDEECKRLFKVLENIMKTQKPYTNPDLKSSQLAEMASTTGHALSFLFNQYLKISYYDYINNYRVEEFKRLVATDAAGRYTLSAMADKCGFSSRASFFRHFKSITGVTPAEYMKSRI